MAALIVFAIFSAVLAAQARLQNSTEIPETTTEVVATTLSIVQKWEKMEANAKISAKNWMKEILPILMENTGNMNISGECMRNVLKLMSGIRDIRTWAISFIDASGKMIDGMLSGTMAAFGEYDQCLNTKAIEERRGKNYGKVLFRGKYCALDLKPPLPPKKYYYKLNDVLDELKNFSERGNVISEASKSAQFFYFISTRFGVCVPSGCTVSDVAEVVKKVTETTLWSAKVVRCEEKEENNYTPSIIAVMTYLSALGFLMLLGSLIELYHYYAQKKIKRLPLQILVCFSFISSFKKLVDTSSSSGNLACLHGLRVLSITWVILGHTYLNVNFQIFQGLRNATLFARDVYFQAVINATVAVDTFFFIGGFLVCYLTVKLIKGTNRKFDLGLYIMHRLFRIIPIYSGVIAFVFLAPLIASGPVWHDTIDKFVDDCSKNWWTNLLFINNFYNTFDICLPQTWYVSCDMQLYIAAILILIPILRWPRVGISLGFLGVLASMIGIGALTYARNYPPTMLFVHPDPEQRFEYWVDSYFRPYSHAGPYCIGILVGYLLATKPNLKFSLWQRVVGWILAIICNMAVLYGVKEWNQGRDPNLAETLLYSSCHRVAWASGVAWVVINCATGQGGVVNYILSWKCWIPLGRLTYAAYLIHPLVQLSAVGHVRMRVMTAHSFAMWIYFGHLALTYGASFAASMLGEAPFISLEKVILNCWKGKPEPTANGKAVMHNADPESTSDNNESNENAAVKTTVKEVYISHL